MVAVCVNLGSARYPLLGLAGLVVLVLTCTDDQSRNRRLGLALGRGQTLQEAQGGIQQVVEGVLASRAVCAVAAQLSVDMPICREIHRVMHEGKPVRDAVQELMGREMRSETE